MPNENTKNDDLTEEDKALLGGSDGEEDGATSDGSSGDDGTAGIVGSGQETLVTRDGLKKLKEELDYLANTRRREIAKRLKEAIGYGDLSENSEYEDAKNEQAFLEGRILELNEMIKNAKIINDVQVKGKIVKIGSTVKIQNATEKDEPETYTIVGSTEANPIEHKISNESPIGSAVIDREQGDTVKVKAPAGDFEYKILKVS